MIDNEDTSRKIILESVANNSLNFDDSTMYMLDSPNVNKAEKYKEMREEIEEKAQRKREEAKNVFGDVDQSEHQEIETKDEKEIEDN